MAWRLLLFLCSHGAIRPSEIEALYRDAIIAVENEGSLFEKNEFGKRDTLLLVIEWATRESAGQKHATGAAGDCGRMQLVFEGARDGHTCKELQADGALDLQLGLRWMHRTLAICKSLDAGLSAYATGSCRSVRGVKLARSRRQEITHALAEVSDAL